MRVRVSMVPLLALLLVVEIASGWDRLLAVSEAAERLGVTERFVRTLIAQRRIAVHRFNGLIRVGMRDLDDYIESSRTEAESEG